MPYKFKVKKCLWTVKKNAKPMAFEGKLTGSPCVKGSRRHVGQDWSVMLPLTGNVAVTSGVLPNH